MHKLHNLVLRIAFVVTALGCASSLVAVTASTVSNAQGAKPRYAILDMQAVILSVDEGRQARKKLEKEIEKKKASLKKDHQELEKLRKDWESKSI